MLIPDFTLYSLALFEKEEMVYSSRDAGLRPLYEALEKFQGRAGLTLHDKVIGLAAARLVARSRIITDIFTLVVSLPAKEFLEERGIGLTAFDYAANILTKDKSAVCPGELLAISTGDPDVFFQKIKDMLSKESGVLPRLM